MLGVTMEESGVTKVITIRLEGEKEVIEKAVSDEYFEEEDVPPEEGVIIPPRPARRHREGDAPQQDSSGETPDGEVSQNDDSGEEPEPVKEIETEVDAEPDQPDIAEQQDMADQPDAEEQPEDD
jgi:chromosome segregation protein